MTSLGDEIRSEAAIADRPGQMNRATGRTKTERRNNYHTARAENTARIAGDTTTSARDAALTLWGAEKPGLVFGSWRIARPANIVQRLLWIKNDSEYSTGLSQMPWITGDEEIYAVGRSLTAFVGRPRKGFYITTEHRPNAVKDVGHPTAKPLPLMEALVAKCPPGVVADPFAGSGSTLVAARNLGRSAIGVEKDERYCEIAATRLGQQAFDFSESASGWVT